MNPLSAVRQGGSFLHVSKKPPVPPSVSKLKEPKLQLPDHGMGPTTPSNTRAPSTGKWNGAQRHRACPQKGWRGVPGVSGFYCTEGEINNLKAEIIRDETK